MPRAAQRSSTISWARLLRDPLWWLVVAAGLLHTGLHYATYVAAVREYLRGAPYFNLHAVHEAEFIAIIALAAFRFRALGGTLLLAFTALASVPYALTPYIFGRDPRPFEFRDRVLEIVIVLAVGALVTLLSELRARDRERRERALAEVQASNRRLRVLHETSEALAMAPTLSEAPGAAARAIVGHLGRGAAAIYLYSTDTDAFLLAARAGLPDDALSQAKVLPGAAIRAPLEGRTWRLLESEGLQNGLDSFGRLIGQVDFDSRLLVPLRVQEEWLGLLAVFASEGSFDAPEIDLLASVGHETALAIRNAQLFESERRQQAVAEGLVRSLRTKREADVRPSA